MHDWCQRYAVCVDNNSAHERLRTRMQYNIRRLLRRIAVDVDHPFPEIEEEVCVYDNQLILRVVRGIVCQTREPQF